MTDEFSLSMSLPVDGDGFLRRECPTCEREFKWSTADSDDEAPTAEEGYFCPYCAVQAPPDSWWTPAQLEAAQTLAYREVVAPELERLRRSVEGIGGGLVSASMSGGESPDLPADNAEDDGMHRVDFDCHDEPVKVLDSWRGPTHCLLCGQPSARG